MFKGAAASDPAGRPWWDGIDQNLSKLFMGPAGTITRLHFDCGEAHAWLGQVRRASRVLGMFGNSRMKCCTQYPRYRPLGPLVRVSTAMSLTNASEMA